MKTIRKYSTFYILEEKLEEFQNKKKRNILAPCKSNRKEKKKNFAKFWNNFVTKDHESLDIQLYTAKIL